MFSGARGGDHRPPATLTLSATNFGAYPMANGLTRLQARFYGEPESASRAEGRIGEALDAEEAEEGGRAVGRGELERRPALLLARERY